MRKRIALFSFNRQLAKIERYVITVAIMKIFRIFAFLIVGQLVFADVPNCKLADSSVEKMISDKAMELKGEEYCQFRIYHSMDDVDGDGREDFIVVFTIEGTDNGTNNHLTFLAFFGTVSEKPILNEVGERGERDITGIEVEGRSIILKTLEYKESDPMCCPSKSSSVTYHLSRDKLVESK